jgi:cytochrome P450
MKKDSYNGHDLLTSMIKQGEINIDKHQLRDEIATFFTAGHDSK